MSRPDAAGEASMEEILASIRKIIAEEPGTPRPLPDLVGPGVPKFAASDLPSEPPPGNGTSRIDRLDDAPRPAYGAPPSPADVSAPPLDELADLLEDASKSEKPAAGPQPRSAGTSGGNWPDNRANPQTSWSLSRVTFGPTKPAGAGDSYSAGAGAVGASSDSGPAALRAEDSAPRAPAAKPFVPALDVSEPALKSSQGAMKPADFDATVTGKSTSRAASSPFIPPPARSEPEVIAAMPAKPSERSSSPMSWTAAPSSSAGSAPAAAATSPITAEAADAGRTGVTGPSDAAASALGALAAGLAASGGISKDPVSREPPADARAAPISKPVPPEKAAADPAQPRTVEDMVTDLLRPMLHQWLVENMPKIVEKALRSEAADSKKPTGKPPIV